MTKEEDVEVLKGSEPESNLEILIFDCPKEEGMEFEFSFGNGLFVKTFVDDKLAKSIVETINNKLAGRGK